jgi:autotransporter-associated beta strand protein
VRWTQATGVQSIPAILQADGINISGWSFSAATGVSSDGTTIVGNGTDPSGYAEGWVAHIPVNAFALLDLAGTAHSIGSLLWGGTVTNSGTKPATLTAGSDNSSTSFSGIIQDGVSPTALNKIGTGTLTLLGHDSYSGGTIIGGGTLDLATLGVAGTGAITFGGAATLKIEIAVLSNHNLPNAIVHFSNGDAVDLSGLTFSRHDKASYNPTTHILTVKNQGATDTLTFVNPTSTHFTLVSDGHGGTEIVLQGGGHGGVIASGQDALPAWGTTEDAPLVGVVAPSNHVMV